MIDDLASTDALRCTCAFCTGAKRRDDNWCPACGEVQMNLPKWWENLDMCDACERKKDNEAQGDP